ncbi:MAG: hypothetical protein C4K58_05705 [Flavobacteriaceae bacterium]|nr:MAG: hypothetical protein C4K58_05705 [Flavobacteriaceae bacterium]
MDLLQRTRKENRIAMNVYGLLGKNISYSFSEKYFKEKFESQNIVDTQYLVFDLESLDNLNQDLFENPQLKGFNITIPYKEKIIEFLDELSPIAKEIGAVNTVKIENGKKIGHNTDAHGFEISLAPFLEKQKHEKALILGTGGASKAILYVLKKLGIKPLVVSRNPTKSQISYLDLTQEIIETHTLVINCSPVGTFPKVDESPGIPYEFITENHLFYDLIYNPEKTTFLAKAQEKGAQIIGGYPMLVGQAEKAWEIWNDPENETDREKNTEIKLEIIEKLNQLNLQNVEDAEYYNQYLDLIKIWKNTGYPTKAKTHQINTDYHKSQQDCLEKILQSPSLVALHHKQNLSIREEILETLEKWLKEDELKPGYHKEWLYLKSKWEKSASPVSLEDEQKTKEKWDVLSNDLEKRRQEILEKKIALFNLNKEKKLALLQEIEAFVIQAKDSNESWKIKSEKFETLSGEFKSIGPVSSKDSTKLWKEFLGLQAPFLKEKNQFYKELKNSYKESIIAKKDLIEKAKLAQNSPDVKQAIHTLKALQTQWKNSGVLPRKEGQKLWEEFQKICNDFFQKTSSLNTKPSKDNSRAKNELFLALQNENFDLDKEKQIELLNSYNLKWFELRDTFNSDLDQNFKTFLQEKAKQLDLSKELEKHSQSLKKSNPRNALREKKAEPKKNLSLLIQEKSKLENNLAFFKNSSKDNPLLKETHQKLAALESEIQSLKRINN